MTIKIYSYDDEEENKILRTVSEEIKQDEFETDRIKKIIDDLFEYTVQQPDGAGLSAPQIGINKRVFIINPRMFDYEENGEVIPKNIEPEDSVYINPKITKASKKTNEMEEGCFSVRWYYGFVTRPEKITMEFYNFKGEKKEIELKGFLSAVAQHEIDHLDGILFIDKAVDVQRLSDKEIDELKNKMKKISNSK